MPKGIEVKEKVEFAVDKDAIKDLRLVAVAYSHVDREWFPTDEAYKAEVEVQERAQEVIKELEKLGIPAKGYPGDQYFLTNILVDKPDLVLNLVDTVRGKDNLQTSIPAALELTAIPYTGSGMQGLVIGNNRNLVKELLEASGIPTPKFQFIKNPKMKIKEDFQPPYIIKLNESGGSVGIDNKAVKETIEHAQKRVEELISNYKVPVVVEQFIGGPEITVAVFNDGRKRHVFAGQKIFKEKADGKHYFTSLESYDDAKSYKYKKLDENLDVKISNLAARAFDALHYKDYAKFDIRLDEATNTPYFIDANPNTAFGPDKGLPYTEILDLHDIKFSEVLLSLISKHARKVQSDKIKTIRPDQ